VGQLAQRLLRAGSPPFLFPVHEAAAAALPQRDVCASVCGWLTTSACGKQLALPSAYRQKDVLVTPALCSLALGGGFARASAASSLQPDRDWRGDLKSAGFYSVP